MTSAEYDAASRDTPMTTRTIHRERMRVAQRIAAGIAHELQNPVFAIASAAQLLRYRTADDPINERNLGRILRESERLNALVAALLEFGQSLPVRLVTGDPDDVWNDVLTQHRGLLESKMIVVHHAPPRDHARCEIDPEQLATAFGNALANAVDAAPEGSDLTIYSTVDADGTWRSVLHNDGPPIQPDIAERAFEPLVTTKPGHAGLGLAVAHRIIDEHAGTIALDGSPDAGTTVTVTLPPSRER
jgi:signal transduction histidine kinase